MTASRTPGGRAAPAGLVLVDKPAGMTSHDVVARIRRLAGTRKVGHAGTLDPMATGVLVVGVEKATRLLGHLTLADKQYLATIRLGQSTSTDDAEGEITAAPGAARVTQDGIATAVAALTGPIEQVPPGISAIKVGGQRAYKLTRDGQAPDLAARPVTVHEFEITALVRPSDADGDILDLEAAVTCSSGTYVRALARDLGQALGTGGHLTKLRRTRSGSYRIEDARTLDELAGDFTVTPLAEAAAAAFPRLDLTADQSRLVAHGGRLPPATLPSAGSPAAVFGPDGSLIALMQEEDGRTRPLAVFVP
ncbi:MAG TPA: tRNA pseudouridine(55) synthase TruB [Streptosporangiaceae bacterium]